MATFVLVHGAWHVAWCWRRVARLLSRSGHEVFTPTLTGVGERSHLLTSEINLDTHILDVVNVMKWQELNDVVLVGHSYGGMVISGRREVGEVHLIFCNARRFLPRDRTSFDRFTAASSQGKFPDSGAQWRIDDPPEASPMFNVNEKDRIWVDTQCTPHPTQCFLQKLTLTRARACPEQGFH